MVLSWVVHALAVSLLLSGAAAAAERCLRLAGRQARGVWLGAMLLSVLLPGACLAVSLAVGMPTPDVLPPEWGTAALTGSVGPAEISRSGAGAASPMPDHWFVWTWAALSAAVLGWLGRSAWRLRRIFRSSPARATGDGIVFRTSGLGPGVVGAWRPRIVVPDWMGELDPSDRELVLLHEREHIRGRDPLLLHAGWILSGLVPWLLPLWWQLRRLRRAAELDCDQRTVARVGDARTYGRILVQAKRFSLGLASPLVTAGDAFLGRRIRRLAGDRRSRPASLPRLALPAFASLIAVTAAALLPPPGTARPAPHPSPVDEEVFSRLDGSFERPPAVANPVEARAMLRERHPERLRRRGIGGEVLVVVHVAPDGGVTGGFVSRGSGYRELDRAALDVAGDLRYTPAEASGEPVGVWIAQPLRFPVE